MRVKYIFSAMLVCVSFMMLSCGKQKTIVGKAFYNKQDETVKKLAFSKDGTYSSVTTIDSKGYVDDKGEVQDKISYRYEVSGNYLLEDGAFVLTANKFDIFADEEDIKVKFLVQNETTTEKLLADESGRFFYELSDDDELTFWYETSSKDFGVTYIMDAR